MSENSRSDLETEVGVSELIISLRNELQIIELDLTLHKLTLILQGELNEIIDALIVHYQTEALKGN